MAITRNGWTQAPAARVAIGAPGCADTGEVRAGDVATVMQAFANAFDAEVEPLTAINGYRSPALNAKVKGDPSSNHLSATALDFNGARHPYERNLPASQRGANYRHGFTSAQVAAIRNLLRRFGGVVFWGLDFNTGYRDAMHFEIRGTAAQVAALAAKVAGKTASPTIPAAPVPTPAGGDDMFVLFQPERPIVLLGDPAGPRGFPDGVWPYYREHVVQKAGAVHEVILPSGGAGQTVYDYIRAMHPAPTSAVDVPALAAAIAKALPSATGGPSLPQIIDAVKVALTGATIQPRV